MNYRLVVSLLAASLVMPGAAFAQSTTVEGAANGARVGGDVAGPVGAAVGSTVGAAVGLGLEIPNAVITSIDEERAPSVVVRERVVVGEPLPAEVELRPVPHYTQYNYAVVNDRRVIVEPRTRKAIKIIELCSCENPRDIPRGLSLLRLRVPVRPQQPAEDDSELKA